MEKFTITLVIGVLSVGFAWGGPAHAGCLQDVALMAARVRTDQDWIRRETVLAMLTEARRDAMRGREDTCISALERARAQLQAAPH